MRKQIVISLVTVSSELELSEFVLDLRLISKKRNGAGLNQHNSSVDLRLTVPADQRFPLFGQLGIEPLDVYIQLEVRPQILAIRIGVLFGNQNQDISAFALQLASRNSEKLPRRAGGTTKRVSLICA